jgi:CRISPR-associated protein Cas2
VVYDIPDDAARAKVADVCLDYGLQRIQFSAFMGDISPNHQHELFLKIQRRLGGQTANVQLFPICERDVRQRRVLSTVAPVAGTRSVKAAGQLQAKASPRLPVRKASGAAHAPLAAAPRRRAGRSREQVRDPDLAGREA